MQSEGCQRSTTLAACVIIECSVELIWKGKNSVERHHKDNAAVQVQYSAIPRLNI